MAAAAGAVSELYYVEAGSDIVPVTVDTPASARMRANIRWAMTKEKSPELASGSAIRSIMDTARETIFSNVRSEPGARWRRVARGAKSCTFCKMLVVRGAVYKSEDAALAGHDNCRCVAEVQRPGGIKLRRTEDIDVWKKQYEQAKLTAGSSDPQRLIRAWDELYPAA